MKKIIFFVTLNLLLNSAIIHAQITIEPRTIPNPFDPGTNIVYTATRDDVNQLFSGCQFQWTITNGTFQPVHA